MAQLSVGAAPVLVTGAGGWLGRAVTAELCSRGVRVRCLVRSRPALPQGDEVITGDLGDRALVAAAVEGCRAVLHLAATVRGRTETEYRAVNVDATASLAAVARSAGVTRFVSVSSRTAVVGAGAYGESKLAGEDAVREALPSAIVLRPGEIYGTGSVDAVTRLLELVHRGPVVPVIASHRALVAPVYLDDVVATCVRALTDRSAPAGVFTLPGPEEMAMTELVRRAAAALGRRVLAVPVPIFAVRLAIALRVGGLTPDRLSALFVAKSADGGPAQRAFGFSPRPIEVGVQEWAARRTSRRP